MTTAEEFRAWLDRLYPVKHKRGGPGNIGQIKRAAADLDRSEQTIRAYASGRHKSRPGKPVNIPPDVRAKMAELERLRAG